MQIIKIANKKNLQKDSIKLTFQSNRKLQGFTGCNAFDASYSQKENFITIDNFIVDKAPCPSLNLDLQEKLLISNLQSTKFWHIDFKNEEKYLFLYQLDKSLPIVLLIL